MSMEVQLILALIRRFAGERGQTMAEYGVLIAVIAVVVVLVAALLGPNIKGLFSSSGGHV